MNSLILDPIGPVPNGLDAPADFDRGFRNHPTGDRSNGQISAATIGTMHWGTGQLAEKSRQAVPAIR
jgi:hypothetical protein